MKPTLFLLAFILANSYVEIGAVSLSETTNANDADSDFVRGADLSMLQYLEGHGVHYLENGRPEDALAIFKDHGCNAVRLRLFVRPDGSGEQVNLSFDNVNQQSHGQPSTSLC